VRRRVVRWFRMQRLIDADATGDCCDLRDKLPVIDIRSL
jgi:hypothetical protein